MEAPLIVMKAADLSLFPVQTQMLGLLSGPQAARIQTTIQLISAILRQHRRRAILPLLPFHAPSAYRRAFVQGTGGDALYRIIKKPDATTGNKAMISAIFFGGGA